MTNLKKIGLSALAGSLVAVSAQAAEMSISGSAVMTYIAKDGSVDATDTGNGIGVDKGMTASASGEMDNGWNVALSTQLNDGATANAQTTSITVDMGDIGTLAYVQADLGGGAEALDDVMPTAHEEPSNGLGTTTAPLASAGSGVGTGFVYSNSFAGAAVSINYAPTSQSSANDQGTSTGVGGGDASASIGITYPVGDTGLTVYLANGTDGNVDGKNHEHDVYALKYAYGPVTVGVQHNEMDDEDSAGADYEADFYAISFAVNDNLSISYGRQETSSSTAGAPDQEVDGFSVGYSMGGMTISAHNNESTGHNNVANASSEHSEVSLTFAF
jgi:outer membrane protein OmpU